MATIHRDGDLSLLNGKVAVVGFGSQGHAHALNLRDSGVEVVVGLRDGSASRAAAEEAGAEVAPIADAVRGAQVVAMLVPDHVQTGFDILVEAGYQPEIAYYECLNELKLIVDLLYEGGYEYMRYSVSDVAEYGDLSRGIRVVDDSVRERMRGILEEIRTGAFAKELFGDDEAGRPRFQALPAEGKRRAEAIERVGAELRTLAGAEGLHGKASSDVAADVGAHGVR